MKACCLEIFFLLGKTMSQTDFFLPIAKREQLRESSSILIQSVPTVELISCEITCGDDGDNAGENEGDEDGRDSTAPALIGEDDLPVLEEACGVGNWILLPFNPY